jgi:hypothetical protein
MAIMTALRRQSCIRFLSQPAADAGPAGGPALDWTGLAWSGAKCYSAKDARLAGDKQRGSALPVACHLVTRLTPSSDLQD